VRKCAENKVARRIEIYQLVLTMCKRLSYAR